MSKFLEFVAKVPNFEWLDNFFNDKVSKRQSYKRNSFLKKYIFSLQDCLAIRGSRRSKPTQLLGIFMKKFLYQINEEEKSKEIFFFFIQKDILYFILDTIL